MMKSRYLNDYDADAELEYGSTGKNSDEYDDDPDYPTGRYENEVRKMMTNNRRRNKTQCSKKYKERYDFDD